MHWRDGAYVAEGLVGPYTVKAEKDGYTIAAGQIGIANRTLNLLAVKLPPEEEPVAPDKKKGCGGSVAASIGSAIVLAALAFALAARKKIFG